MIRRYSRPRTFTPGSTVPLAPRTIAAFGLTTIPPPPPAVRPSHHPPPPARGPPPPPRDGRPLTLGVRHIDESVVGHPEQPVVPSAEPADQLHLPRVLAVEERLAFPREDLERRQPQVGDRRHRPDVVTVGVHEHARGPLASASPFQQIGDRDSLRGGGFERSGRS